MEPNTDTIAYLTKYNNNDAETLQKDLDKLGHWENEWCMKFHPDKCTVLRVTNKKKIIDAKYQLHGHTLESVTSAKYLGLTFTNKLQWDQDINYITSKTNKTLRFLRRNLKIPSIRINEQAYFTLARPLVEYASTIWDPYTQTDINKVEAVQRRASRYVANNHRNRSSVSNIIQRLKWKPLADRRKDTRLVMLYKIDRELQQAEKPENHTTDHSRYHPPVLTPGKCHSFQEQYETDLLAPDIVVMDTPAAFKARIVSL